MVKAKKKDLLRLGKIKCFLLDMDGTIYLGNTPFPGAVEFVKKLKSTGRQAVYLSNNSSKNSDEYLSKLIKLGFPAEPGDIYTSLTATIIYLKSKNIQDVYALGTPGFEQELLRNGITLTDKKPQAVLLGFDMTITYEKIRTAYELISKETPFFATHPDILCPTETGFIPDAGGFIAMFEKLTGRSPRIIGKPYPTMVNGALKKYGVKKSETAMIGDRGYTDIRMGVDSGLLTILVFSGETKSTKGLPWKPEIIATGIGELTKHL